MKYLPRQCTRDFKIDLITKEVNRMRRETKSAAIVWVGISTDEIWRAKENRNSPRIINRHPLLEERMSRHDCAVWCERRNYHPPRSACWYCGFKSDAEWADMKRFEPATFAEAVKFDYRYRENAKRSTTMTGEVFLHKSCKPLDQVDFSTPEEKGQTNLFNNECEGGCGV